MRGSVTLLCCAALLACGGDKEERPARAEATPAPAPAEVAPKLTVEALLAAKRGVKPYDEWDAAWAHLTRTAGPPTRVEGDLHGWYLVQGEECFVLEVVRDAREKRVDSVRYGPFAMSDVERCGP